jgi:uncharacterized protein (TIGR02996 family)
MSTPFTDEDKAFIRAILDHPDELTTWLVYADWLEDRGDPRAEFLRLTAERRQLPPTAPRVTGIEAHLGVLRETLDSRWLLVFEAARLVNCRRASIEGTCPWNTWDRLSSTDDPDIRICHQCSKPVFACATAGEARDFVSCGQIVALSPRIPPEELPDRYPFRPDRYEVDDFEDFHDGDTLAE